jgi:hypothetical protein
MNRLFANGCAFLSLAFAGLLYLYNYEAWWARRGRDAYIRYQTAFFDQSVASPHIAWRLIAAVLLGTFLAWLIFEGVSRLLLLILGDRSGWRNL